MRDVGLIASEGRMTIPLADGTASGVLDVTTHYFEFIPEEEVDSPQPTVLAAHEVQEGGRYFILPTTAYGLYRYHIHDLVRVTGFHNRTPLVEFLSKGAHFANLTGEKLSEYHVTQAMAAVLRRTGPDADLPTAWRRAGTTSRRTTACSWSGDLADAGQGSAAGGAAGPAAGEENIEYRGKRDSLRLGPVRLELLPAGAWAQWDRRRLQRNGGSLEQYKHPCLINDVNFRATMPVEAEATV